MAHTCNTSTLGGRGGWITKSGVQDQPSQHSETLSLLKTQKNQPGMVVGTFDPSYSGGWGRRIAWTQEAEVAVSYCATVLQCGQQERNSISTGKKKKNKKVSQAWWHVSVFPATQEAEAGELLEPRRRGQLWAEIAPLNSSLGDRLRLCLKNKNKNNETVNQD